MSDVSTTAKLNGRTVKSGDTIVSFRGEEYTFDYMHDGKVFTKEAPNGFYARVFPDDPPPVKPK